MRPSHISSLFLGSFTIAILLLERWQQASYPRTVWVFLGLFGSFGFLLSFLRQPQPGTAALGEQTKKGSGRSRPRLFSIGIANTTLGITCALLAVQRIAYVPSPDAIELFVDGSTRTLHGIIVDEPDRRGLSVRYLIEAAAIQEEEGMRVQDLIHGRVLVTDPDGLPRLSYGDEVRVSGILERPEGSYANYLATKDTWTVMQRARVESISGGHASRPMRFLLTVKSRFQRQLNRIFPEPEASLLSGLLLGTRNMPKRLEESFRRSGLMHITAISGFNITLVLNAIGWMFFFVPFRWRLIPSAIAVSAFTLLVGASASAVRAAIMGVLGLLALQLERPKEVRLMTLWAFFAMALGNPRLPWYDPGFQLSFLAVIGITELAPAFRDRLLWIPDILGTRGNFAATLAAQIFVLPILAAQFGTLSLVAPLANILVAPAIPAAMLLGFLGVIVSFLSFLFGQLISFLCFGYLLWIREAAEFTAQFPFAEIAIENPTLWMIGAYYGMLMVGIAIARSLPSPQPSPTGRGGTNGIYSSGIQLLSPPPLKEEG